MTNCTRHNYEISDEPCPACAAEWPEGFTRTVPTESGFYHYINGWGIEEIISLSFSDGGMQIIRFGGGVRFASDVTGLFGPRVALLSENDG